MTEFTEYRKASFSGGNDGGDCVEVAFRKATASVDSANCVEVAQCACPDIAVRVRDSKNPDGPVLGFTRAEWDAFKAGVLAGEF